MAGRPPRRGGPGNSKPVAYQKPAGTVRRSQVVRTNGPGAMIDLVDHAVMVGGLDFWRYAPQDITACTLSEPRLRDRLEPRFVEAGRRLAQEGCFRLPPLGEEKKATPDSGIEVLELPRWFVCQNPACRALVHADGLAQRGSRYRHECIRPKGSESVPVRFVATCRRGHVEEFPWVWFAHRNVEAVCPAPSLKLQEGATGDFSEILVKCACGAQERLSTALIPNSLPHCEGHRPWLGEAGRESCEEKHLRLLVRSASNAYFGQEVSALSIPERGRKLEAAARQVWHILQVADAASLPAFRSIPQVKDALGTASDADVLAVIEQIRIGGTPVREPLRTAEYRQLVAVERETPGELPPDGGDFFAREATPDGGPIPKIARLVLIPKLRDVRVQIGFTRLEPVMPDLEGEFDLAVQSAPLSLTQDWLPASEVRGEGVFIQLDEKAVWDWERRPEVQARERELAAGYRDWLSTLTGDKAPPFPGVRFYLLHSLSHLLLTAISLECGYAASAIRERIYCSRADSDTPMAAILLSTGSPGTEGTLGGLVEQGRNLRRHLRRALRLGELCSNDPVCAGHSPQNDHSERFLEGAACHGCLFVAESSCERFNRYLDRSLVVPTLGHPPELAFFEQREGS
ncbi:MAG: DUF1998 domain-containing protein [Acidobacteria bacterium]|nr:DUF1998 domain-containing protein [Acidobacteriota bacterium]